MPARDTAKYFRGHDTGVYSLIPHCTVIIVREQSEQKGQHLGKVECSTQDLFSEKVAQPTAYLTAESHQNEEILRKYQKYIWMLHFTACK